MLGTGTTRLQQDAPDRAADLVGYLRSGPRELPPGVPSGEPNRGPRRPIISALACVAVLAGVLVGCQIVKPKPTASPSASSGTPTPGRTTAGPSPSGTKAKPSPTHTVAKPTPSQSSSLPASPPSGALPTLPSTSGALSTKVSNRVFAARTVHIRVVVLTPQAHTVRETLTGTVSVARDGTLTGTGFATADRYNGVHVSAPLIFRPGGEIYIAPPARLMPAGKTWVKVTPDVPNGRASYSARQAAYVLYASVTSWNLLRYAKTSSRPSWQGSGPTATAHMSGTVVLAKALPHTTPGAHDAVITFAGPGTKEATWRVVLDRRLLPRRCVIKATSPVLGPITAYVSFSNWGVSVHAAAPPTSEVATVDELPDYLRQADP